MKYILIVEDDPVGKVVMQKMLETDFSCVVVETPGEALEHVRQNPVDGLVLDINLGDDSIDGSRLLQEIRKIEGYGGIRAVATTAYAMSGDEQHFLDSGFNAYVSKPVRVNELLETMHRVFD